MEELNWGMIITQALLFWLAYKIGQISIIHRIGKDLAEELDKKGLLVEKDGLGNISITKEECLLEIERVQSWYYAYSKQGEFLGQAQDFRDLMEIIKKNHPGRNFKVEKYQPNLTEEETGRLIKSIFDVFGNKEMKDGERRN